MYTIKVIDGAKMMAQPVKRVRIFHGSIPMSYLANTPVVRLFRSKDKGELVSIFFHQDGKASLFPLVGRPLSEKSTETRRGIKVDMKASHLNTRNGEVVVVVSGNVSERMYATISYEYDEISDDGEKIIRLVEAD